MDKRIIGGVLLLCAAACLMSWAEAQSQSSQKSPQPATKPATATPAANAVAKARMLGTWKTKAPDGTSIVLSISDASRSQWTFTRDGKSTTVAGTYVLGEGTLMLNDPQQGPMVGQIKFNADDSFTFSMPGAPAGEGELVFQR